MNVTTTVEGLERYPVNVRYNRELRNDLGSLRRILISTPMGHEVPLGQLATIEIKKGPPAIKSENARRTAWIYVDLEGIDVGTYVQNAKDVVASDKVQLPPGVSLVWSGQYEYMERAAERLALGDPPDARARILCSSMCIFRISPRSSSSCSHSRSRWSAGSG